LKDIYEARIKERTLHVIRQAAEGTSIDDTPFYRGVSIFLTQSGPR